MLLSSANDINTYDAAVAKVNRLVVHFFGDSPKDKKVRFRISGVTATDFADRHQNGKCYYKDVDITDFCHKFSDEEGKTICQNNELRSAIIELRQKTSAVDAALVVSMGSSQSRAVLFSSTLSEGKWSTSSSPVSSSRGRLEPD